MIHFYGKIVKFCTYRSGRLTDVQMTIDDLSDNDKKKLSSFLTKNGYKMDNHICFMTSGGMSVMYSDNKLLIGCGEINAVNW